MSSASSATVGDPGDSYHAICATQQVKSAGELTLTTMRRIDTRVMTRQSRVNFVPRRGIMLQSDPHLLFTLLYFPSCHVIVM